MLPHVGLCRNRRAGGVGYEGEHSDRYARCKRRPERNLDAAGRSKAEPLFSDAQRTALDIVLRAMRGARKPR
jgi:hypothetical protein